MNFFLGIFPDKDSIKKILDISNGVEEVFSGFDIPVRWSIPQNYHITLIHLGEHLPFYKRLILKYKLKKFKLEEFVIKFNTVKLGISRKYKELIYLDLLEGGDEMRKLFLEIRELLNIQKEGNFLPHLTLGRVSKELTDQEYSNICKDLSVVTKKLGINEVKFSVSDIKLVKSTEKGYQILMNFNDSSSIKS